MTLFFGWTYERDFKGWVRDPVFLARVNVHKSPVFREGAGYKLILTVPGQPMSVPLVGLTTLMDMHLTSFDKKQAEVERRRRQQTKISHVATYGRGAVARKKKPPGPKKTTPFSHLHGHELGSFVHRQVMDVIFCASPEEFHRRPNNQWGLHPYVPRLIHLLLQRGIRPFLAEFRTYSRELSSATQIDVVGVDQLGRIVFIELKTGYSEGAFDTETPGTAWRVPMFRDHQRTWACTPRNMAILQIVLGGEFAVREMALPRNMIRYIVVRLDAAGNNFIEVNPTFAQILAIELYAHVKSSVPLLKSKPSKRRSRKARR